MVPQPDTQSFSRLLVTLGLFLCVVAVVGPVLVLRDTAVLEIKIEDLKELTPVAKAEIERRQRSAATAGDAAPWIAFLVFVSGCVALGFGIPRLLKQEAASDTRTELELDTLRGELRQLTPAERRDSLERTVETELASNDLEVDATGEDPTADEHSGTPATSPPALESEASSPNAETEGAEAPEASALGPGRQQRMRDIVRVTDKVIDRLAKIVTDKYELRWNVALALVGSYAEMDAVFASREPGGQDVVVEIKVPLRLTRTTIHKYVSQVSTISQRYAEGTGRPTRSWLIIVADDLSGVGQNLDVLLDAYASKNQIEISLIGTSDVSELSLPPSMGGYPQRELFFPAAPLQ